MLFRSLQIGAAPLVSNYCKNNDKYQDSWKDISHFHATTRHLYANPESDDIFLSCHVCDRKPGIQRGMPADYEYGEENCISEIEWEKPFLLVWGRFFVDLTLREGHWFIRCRALAARRSAISLLVLTSGLSAEI